MLTFDNGGATSDSTDGTLIRQSDQRWFTTTIRRFQNTLKGLTIKCDRIHRDRLESQINNLPDLADDAEEDGQALSKEGLAHNAQYYDAASRVC